MTKLKDTVSAIKAVLLDAEEKQASDHRLSHWLKQLKDVLKEAEDVLDEFQYRVLQKEVMKRCKSTCKKVRYFFSGSNPLVFRFEMAHKIKRIRERVDDISALKAKFNLDARLEDRKTTMHRRDMTHSFIPSQNQDADRIVSVIPIVGIGGLGKTTLAKLVYNDEQVVRHFQLKILITEILKLAISIDENLSIDQLQMRLRELIKDKKFLLVLDDVWNDDCKKWIELKNLLLGGGNGSKIIVTTRNSFVADIMSTTECYNLDGLSQNDCLSLEIVKKCKGIPLAMSTLAGLLYSKVDEREWKFVRDNEIWNLEQKEGDILPALKLSYTQLPFHLKQCLAFCSIFPKDFEFNSLYLIQFWMAHGILQSSANESQELEDVGDLYIKELLARSFFQDFRNEELLYTFKMHDLVHDLALSIAKGEYSVVTKKSTLAAEVCHLSILESGQEVTTQLERLSKVHTIIFKIEQPMSIVKACISRFKFLRVLDLCKSSFEVLPNSIGTLKHLRYLDLSGNSIIKQLPDSICKLHSLQTLLLGGCNNLEQLPKGIKDIISLRFLIVTTKHTCLSEKAVGCLDSLRFLWIGECENLKFLFEGMEGLMEMEGEDNQDLKLSLQNLIIEGLPKLKVLPQWLQGSANTLQLLAIMECENLKALPEWLPRLKSLHILGIIECPKLSSLSKGMEDLTALSQLTIDGCPDLSRKCREEDLHKIAHVPLIYLEGTRFTIEKKMASVSPY
ncbi:hypothetical protein ACB092_09G211700 [Castanea dentata]